MNGRVSKILRKVAKQGNMTKKEYRRLKKVYSDMNRYDKELFLIAALDG